MTSTQAVRRFDAALPASSFELVRQAAELSGMTVRSFVAMATFERAIKLLRAGAKVSARRVVLDPEESDALEDLIKNEDRMFGPTLSQYRQLGTKVRIL